MTTFDERERAFENLFAHDEELRFKAEAHRTKALALWAARRMGKTDGDADGYAQALVNDYVAGVDSETMLTRLQHDFAAAGILVNDGELHAAFDQSSAEAIRYTREH